MNTKQIIAKFKNARFNPDGQPQEHLAFINSGEADLLRKFGGSGQMTPMGVPSFAHSGGGNRNGAGGMAANPRGSLGPTRGNGSNYGLESGFRNASMGGNQAQPRQASTPRPSSNQNGAGGVAANPRGSLGPTRGNGSGYGLESGFRAPSYDGNTARPAQYRSQPQAMRPINNAWSVGANDPVSSPGMPQRSPWNVTFGSPAAHLNASIAPQMQMANKDQSRINPTEPVRSQAYNANVVDMARNYGQYRPTPNAMPAQTATAMNGDNRSGSIFSPNSPARMQLNDLSYNRANGLTNPHQAPVNSSPVDVASVPQIPMGSGPRAMAQAYSQYHQGPSYTYNPETGGSYTVGDRRNLNQSSNPNQFRDELSRNGQRLFEAQRTAALDNGITARAFSGLAGRTGTNNHPRGNAIDTSIFQDGRYLPSSPADAGGLNPALARAFRPYEQFAQDTKTSLDRSGYRGPSRWGGYFSRNSPVSYDLMHMDVTPGLGTAGGSWNKGATRAQMAGLAGATSAGIGAGQPAVMAAGDNIRTRRPQPSTMDRIRQLGNAIDSKTHISQIGHRRDVAPPQGSRLQNKRVDASQNVNIRPVSGPINQTMTDGGGEAVPMNSAVNAPHVNARHIANPFAGIDTNSQAYRDRLQQVTDDNNGAWQVRAARRITSTPLGAMLGWAGSKIRQANGGFYGGKASSPDGGMSMNADGTPYGGFNHGGENNSANFDMGYDDPMIGKRRRNPIMKGVSFG